jgi:hypothetical protein
MGEQYKAPVVSNEVTGRLASGGTAPIPVTVTFARDLPAAELEKLGLHSATTGASSIAYGDLAPDRVRELATRPGVKSISLAPILPVRADAPATAAGLDKIQPLLRSQLDARPAEKHAVIVSFRGKVTKDTLKSLSLSEMVDDAGRGDLDKAGVLRMAERPDVRRIEAVPEMRARSPR